LTLADLLAYAKSKPMILTFLPDEMDWNHLDRHWVCDVIYTVDQDGLSDMIHDAQAKRNEKLEKSRDLLVAMKPEFV